jgi:hypothetical protein
MALLDDLAKILARLAPRGWAALLQQHGGSLDITKPKAQLAAELRRQLTGINRQHAGFEELSTAARRAIEPGAPARSLLYHALASPDVHPLTAGARTDADYPTLEDLDVVENYIFSLAPRKLSSFGNPVIAVFACQYRTRAHTPHGQHADLAFSRAGVARVGTETERYHGPSRSFNPLPVGGDRGFAALPARYVAYIAEYGAAAATHAVLRPVPGLDGQLTFAMPAHKLFAGNECLLAENGTPINLPSLQFAELHVNEKLARIHRNSPDNPGRVSPPKGFDLSAPPFVRTSKTSRDLAKLQISGSAALVLPVANALVRIPVQNVNGKRETVRFKVPKEGTENRFWSSLQIPATGNGRAAPEYANIRLEITQSAAGQSRKINLNDVPEPPAAGQKSFEKKLKDGNYEAAHLIDSTCDGAVTIKPLLAVPVPILPAFSLVTAVDYYPQVEQAVVIAWLEKKQGTPIGLSNPELVFPQGGPQPLSDGRFNHRDKVPTLKLTKAVPNSTLPDPTDPSRTAFPVHEKANLTASAVVGFASSGASPVEREDSAGVSSWLPDAASDVFMPGWDVSQYTINGRRNYVAFGLGSPFPEDSKLCAALNSFWPAVAPDASRTFGFSPPPDPASPRDSLPTSIPLLDGELGYHPQHPRVLGAEVISSVGWDGDQGPFLDDRGAPMLVNASNPLRSDQSQAALAGALAFSGLDRVDSSEFIRRIEELSFCRRKIFPVVDATMTDSWLVTVERVDDWATWSSTVLPRANPALTGDGFIFIFAAVDSSSAVNASNPPYRLAFNVSSTLHVQLARTVAFWRFNNNAFQRLNR